jgi:hypothetical protein
MPPSALVDSLVSALCSVAPITDPADARLLHGMYDCQWIK